MNLKATPSQLAEFLQRFRRELRSVGKKEAFNAVVVTKLAQPLDGASLQTLDNHVAGLQTQFAFLASAGVESIYDVTLQVGVDHPVTGKLSERITGIFEAMRKEEQERAKRKEAQAKIQEKKRT